MRTVGMTVGGKTVRKAAVKAAPAQGDQGASGPEGKKPAPKAAKKPAPKGAKEPEGTADEPEA